MNGRCPGTVYLVGAGPGDPDLITVRGLALIRAADVIIHDRLIPAELLRHARGDAEIIDVGKVPGRHRISQDRINELIVGRARQGNTVVRLKGGDPFVFGRGFEELTACRAACIDCVVVPGVSSALAAPEAAGIPVTHRGLVRSFAVISAQRAPDAPGPDLDHAALAKMDAVIVLMGRGNLRDVTRRMIAAGRDGSTAAACIERATTPRQRITVATLATVADAVDRDGMKAPIVAIIGEVARFARDKQTNAALAELSACPIGAHSSRKQ